MTRCEVQPGVPHIGTNGRITAGVVYSVHLWTDASDYEIRVHRTSWFTSILRTHYDLSEQQAVNFIQTAVRDFVLERLNEIKARYQGEPLDLLMSDDDFQQAFDQHIGSFKGEK